MSKSYLWKLMIQPKGTLQCYPNKEHHQLVQLRNLYGSKKADVYSRSLLGPAMCEIMQNKIMCQLPMPIQAQPTNSLSMGWTWMETINKILL
jgi:hypothetical protein